MSKNAGMLVHPAKQNSFADREGIFLYELNAF